MLNPMLKYRLLFSIKIEYKLFKPVLTIVSVKHRSHFSPFTSSDVPKRFCDAILKNTFTNSPRQKTHNLLLYNSLIGLFIQRIGKNLSTLSLLSLAHSFLLLLTRITKRNDNKNTNTWESIPKIFIF